MEILRQGRSTAESLEILRWSRPHRRISGDSAAGPGPPRNLWRFCGGAGPTAESLEILRWGLGIKRMELATFVPVESGF